MTLDQLQAPRRAIAELEALGRRRSRAEDHELGDLTYNRDNLWRRLPAMHRNARRRAAELAAYAAQHRLALD